MWVRGEEEEEDGEEKRERENWTIYDRPHLLARSPAREEDSRGNTWYFVLSNAQVFKIIR